jgi:torulene dioxygenase
MDPKKPCKWYLIDRRGGKGVVGVYESKTPFFAFHSVNAWDEDDAVVCEVPVYNSLDILKKFYINHLKGNEAAAEEWVKKGQQSVLTRYRLQPGTTQVKVEWEVGHNWGMELPTLNPLFVMKPHRYVLFGVLMVRLVDIVLDTLTP